MSEQIVEWQTRLRQAAMKAISEEDMRSIFQNLADKAKRGDLRALDMLMRYLQPPPPPVNVERLTVKGGAPRKAVRQIEVQNGKETP